MLELLDELEHLGLEVDRRRLRMDLNENPERFTVGAGRRWRLTGPEDRPVTARPAALAPATPPSSGPVHRAPAERPRHTRPASLPSASGLERELRERLHGCRIVAEIGLDLGLLR